MKTQWPSDHDRRIAGIRVSRIGILVAIILLVLLPLLAAISAGARAAVQGFGDRPFTAFAIDILAGLEAVSFDRLPATGGYGAPRIAVRPFGDGDSPLPPVIANAYNQRLLAELQCQGGNRYQYVARQSLAPLIEEIRNAGLSPADTEARINDLRQSARADVLIVGTIRLDDGDAVVSYQAVDTESGSLLASTLPRRVTAEDSLARDTVSDPAPDPADLYRARVPVVSRRPLATGRIVPSRIGALRKRQAVVLETERLLALHGYDPGRIDGVLTRQTRDAIRAYQADSALPINGRVTRRMVENLRRDTR